MSAPSSPTSFTAPPGWRRGSKGPVTDLGRLLLGVSIVALGVVFLLGAADVLDAGRAIDRWWPLVIVAAGLFTLAERPPAVLRGLLLTAVGATLLLFTTDTVGQNGWDYVWPAAIITAGLMIVARWNGRPLNVAGVSPGDDVVRATAIFGGPHIVSSSQQFRGGWLTAVFGGVTLDLRNALLAPEGATISATVAFGGVEVLVPKGWRLDVRGIPIFGGVDDKTDHSVLPADDAPTLSIDAVAVFGGVDIKHEK